jgi:hypothetical protein
MMRIVKEPISVFTTIIVLFSIITAKAQTIPNAGFENWTSFGTYENPNDWFTYNSLTSSFGIATVEKESPGASGNYGLKVSTKSFSGSNFNGLAGSGTLDAQFRVSGFACNTKPAMLYGKYKYQLSGNDTAMISVGFTQWIQSSQTQNNIGSGIRLITSGNQNTWTNFAIPITYYFPGLIPDSAIITIYSSTSNTNSVAGNYVAVDDLSFQPITGIYSLESEDSFGIYPNPSSGIFNISDNKNITLVEIYNTLGEEVIRQTNQKQINLHDYPKGIYFARINAKTYIKLMLE